jgi:hypothetical protein
MMKMKRRGSDAAAWSLATLLLLSAAMAHAQPSQDQTAAAEALFREGRDLVEKGRYAEACPKFAASQRLDPGYGTLWNLADCLSQSGRTASAWAAFREAADTAKKAGQADREAKAARRAAALEPRLERMTISVKDPAPGLLIKRGDGLVDSAAWGSALPVDPGKHLIQATAPGKTPFTTEVETQGPGKTVTVEIPPLADAPAAPPPAVATRATSPDATPAPTPPSSADSAGTRRTVAFVAGGVGLAGVVVGSIFGLSARSQWSEAQDKHCRTDVLCDEQGVALVGNAKAAATVSTVGFIAGGVALAAGVALFVTSLGKGKANTARLVVAPAMAPRQSGLVVLGRF